MHWQWGQEKQSISSHTKYPVLMMFTLARCFSGKNDLKVFYIKKSNVINRQKKVWLDGL